MHPNFAPPTARYTPAATQTAPPLYRKQRRMSNPVTALWSLLSLMVAGMATFALVQPFWIIEPKGPDCLGVYSYCVKDVHMKHRDRQLCGIYGGNFSLSNLPSGAWKACCAMFGLGCLLHLICGTFSLISLCLKTDLGKRVSALTGAVQAIAVVLSILGLIAFPAGFSSPFVRHYCRTSAAFNTGICEIGWGFLLAAMATALSIFCPILAQFYDIQLCERRYHLAPTVDYLGPPDAFLSGVPTTHIPSQHSNQLGFYPDCRQQSVTNMTGVGTASFNGSVGIGPGSPGGDHSLTNQYTTATTLSDNHYRFDIPPGYIMNYS